MDALIARVASRQGGYVTAEQLLGLGLTRRAIRWRLERHLLIAVFRGVYAVGSVPADPRQRAHGALLAAGPDAALSHTSAAPLLGIYSRWLHPFEVTTPHNRRPSGLIVHQTRSLPPVDVLSFDDGLRATNRARTLLDLAPTMTPKRLLRAVNGQRIDYHLSLTALHDVLERFPRHPGAKALRAIVSQAPDEPFRSDWEVEWPPFARKYSLPPYDMNVLLVPGVRADVLFRPRLVIFELDGWGAHGLRPAFRSDRSRDRRVYAELGIPSFRITRDDLHDDPAGEAARIIAIVERRRRELGL